MFRRSDPATRSISSESLHAFCLLQGLCTICNSAQAHCCNRNAHLLLKPVRSDLQHSNRRGGDVLLCKSTVALTVAGADYSRLGNLQRKLIELMSSERRKMSCFLVCGFLLNMVSCRVPYTKQHRKSVLHVSCRLCTACLRLASRWADHLRL